MYTGAMTDRLVTVARFDTVVEARFAAARLKDAGFETWFHDGNFTTSHGLGAIAACGVHLRVRAEDEAYASRVLDDHRARAAERHADPQQAGDTCAPCGAELPDDATACPECGWTWEAKTPTA